MNRLAAETRSRRMAREIVKKIHPFIRPDQHVHHIDGNPLNNDIRNLCVLPNSFHMSFHHVGREYRKGFKKPIDLKRDLKHLEYNLFFYNNNIWP